MSQEWIDSIQDHNLRAVLNASNPIAFGSRNAGVGWQLWSTGDRILGERRQKALAIFAFDAFTGNPDRRDTKPNLLVRGEDFRIIDHEFCFGIRTKLFPKIAPWELGNLSNLVNQVIQKDAEDFASQHSAFVTDPLGEIHKAMEHAKSDAKTKDTYDQFIRVMVYDKNAPSFEDAFSAFYQTLKLALPNLSR